jgi:putative peptide zinc metalloprotease protein
VLDGGQRVPMVSELTIGRAPGSTLVLSDPSVSRMHARITADAVLEDIGSSHGTWLDGVRVTEPAPLRDGAKIRLGDAELRVERRRDMAEAGRTMFVPAGATGFMPSVGSSGTQFGMRPRVRSGYALKRLDASEGRQRWVLKDQRSGTFLRLSDNDAWVFELFDGTHTLLELVAMCEQRFGATGSARLVRLIRLPTVAAGQACHCRSSGLTAWPSPMSDLATRTSVVGSCATGSGVACGFSSVPRAR